MSYRNLNKFFKKAKTIDDKELLDIARVNLGMIRGTQGTADHIRTINNTDFEGFLKSIERPDRTFTTEFAQPFFQDGMMRVLGEVLDKDKPLPIDKARIVYRQLNEEYRANVNERVREAVGVK